MDIRSLTPKKQNQTSRSGGVVAGHNSNPFTAMRQEMERLFDGFSTAFGSDSMDSDGSLLPKVDVAETDDGLEIIADVPGVAKENIELDYADGMLTLKASTQSEKEEKDEEKHYYHIERSSGSYLRQFAMPFAVDEDKIKADLADGVLKISIPKSEESKASTRRISIGG